MTNFREKINAHLPIVLQSLSTISFVVIALASLCGSQSLKKLVENHQVGHSPHSHAEHLMKNKSR